MSATEAVDELLAFALGYARVRPSFSTEVNRDVEIVQKQLGPRAEAIGEVSVRWSGKDSPEISLVGPDRVPKVLQSCSAVAFARGILSASLRLDETENGDPLVRVAGPRSRDLDGALLALGVVWQDGDARTGAAALDVLGRIVEGTTVALPSFHDCFEDWRTRVAHVQRGGVSQHFVRAQLVHPGAVVPHKAHVSDSGYDLSLLYEKKRLGPTVLYGTGIIIEPPYGWYFDVVPRSSIIKRGYVLANSVGVIDRSYRGEIFVPLTKIDPDAPDLELPARVVQLIPRPIVHFPVVRVEALSDTQRGSGGFGSTGS